jgi:hypothetical protein
MTSASNLPQAANSAPLQSIDSSTSPTSTTSINRLHNWLAALSHSERTALGRRYAEGAAREGAYVTLPDGATVPIPPILTPVVIDSRSLAEITRDARALLSSLTKLTRHLMREPHLQPVRRRLFSSFTSFEKQALETTYESATALCTARVDFLLDAQGRARALEVNATIPAMQGYADAIAQSFLRSVAEARGASHLEIDRLIDDNRRNTDELLASLLAHHARLTGASANAPLALFIVARQGDAQRGELDHYARRWTALGHEVAVVVPEEVRRVGDAAEIRGRTPDLIYRHIFARRLDPAGDFARMCLSPERFRILNPIASHLEVKGMLGLLSQAASRREERRGAALGLTDEERAAIGRRLPWTRLLVPGPGSGPDEAALPDLVEYTRTHGDSLVLKRSWDYGGRGVFLGIDLEEPSTQARLRALLGRDHAISWSELVTWCSETEDDAWVVQERISSPKQRHLRVEADGLAERDFYVDLSTFTNLGAEPSPTGGAARAALSRIVNIQGGGGLVPLIREEVVGRLFP